MELRVKGLNGPVDEQAVLADMFKLRRQIFVERLGWNLAIEGGQERDQFDNEDATYGVIYEQGVILGSFRLVPMDRPNLAADVFADQIPTPVPADPRYIEATRFCLNPSLRLTDRRSLFRAIQALCEFAGELAIELDGEMIFALAEVRWAKLLVTCGIQLQRLSEDFDVAGKPCGIGQWDPRQPIGRRAKTRAEDRQAANRLVA